MRTNINSPRNTSRPRKLAITGLVTILAIAPVALAADATPPVVSPGPGAGSGAVSVNPEQKLNGRYSFSAHGWYSTTGYATDEALPISRIGTIVFDGNGNVKATMFFETLNTWTTKLGGPENGGIAFVEGTYTVKNNELAKVHLHFRSELEWLGQTTVVHRFDHWDLALKAGGKGFYLATNGDGDIGLAGRTTMTGEGTLE